MTLKRSVLWTLTLLILVVIVAETTTLDLWIQDHFYRFDAGHWWIDKDDPLTRKLFYTWTKRAILIIGIAIIITLIWTWKFNLTMTTRRGLILLALGLTIVPGAISGLKNITNVHCPWSLERYGGQLPHLPLFASQPSDFPEVRPGKCWPAGHPSGGFAFMMLFFVFRNPLWRKLGLGFGLSLGWIMGSYQMLKGAHFFSHVLITMLLSWLLILSIVSTVDHLSKRRPRPAKSNRP
ncbi:MAG: phosphatase PAP2 family protein [Magnetococcales bacterium]|nr:phosphatase PAP2 family protein [Magnetococcales bacterium]